MAVRLLGVLAVVLLLRAEICESVRGFELEQTLFTNYSSNVRPVKNSRDRIDVVLYIALNHVEAVDDHRQSMTIHGYLSMFWSDYRLTFNRTERDPYLTVNAWMIWKPDITFYTSVSDTDGTYSIGGNDAYITSSGTVSYSQSFSTTVACSFDYTYYPFDVQTCKIGLFSMVYDYAKLDWRGRDPDSPPMLDDKLDETAPMRKQHMSGWEIVSANVSKIYSTIEGEHEVRPINDTDAWSVVYIRVTCRRHQPYFLLMEVVPMLAAATLTLVSFWVEASNVASILLLTTILGQGIFSWEFVVKLPPTAGPTPRIALAYAMNLGMTFTAFILHVILQYLADQDAVAGLLPAPVTSLIDQLYERKPFRVEGLVVSDRRKSVAKNGIESKDASKIDPVDADSTTEIEISDPESANVASGTKVFATQRRITKLVIVSRRVFFFVFLCIYVVFIIAIVT